MGMGMVLWEWEGIGTEIVLPAHLYSVYQSGYIAVRCRLYQSVVVMVPAAAVLCMHGVVFKSNIQLIDDADRPGIGLLVRACVCVVVTGHCV